MRQKGNDVTIIQTNTDTTTIHTILSSIRPATDRKQYSEPEVLSRRHSVPPSLRSTTHQFIPALPPHYSHRSRPSQCCDKSAQPSLRRPIVNGQHSNHLLDVRSRLSRGLQEDETVLFRKLGSLLRRHGTTMLDIGYDSYRWFRSDLLPISMITMFEDPFSRASVNHLVSCVNVSRRVISYTSSAPAAPR